MSVSTFKPKQCLSINKDTLTEFLGSSAESVAQQVLLTFFPLPPDSFIHDNGCGAGTVTRSILAERAATACQGLHIEATDRDPGSFADVQGQASREGWPVRFAEMDCAALDFPDDTFSHSIMNFVILQAYREDVACMREMYRTLRKDGLAIVTTWEDLPTMAVFSAAHRHVRGSNARRSEILERDWYSGEHVRKAMLAAGFEEKKIRVERYATRVRVRAPRRWCEIGWTISGGTPGGWTEEDEERWDDAILKALETLTRGPWYEKDKDGEGGWLNMVASAIVATK